MMFQKVKSTDVDLIEWIAKRYYEEWFIPLERTRQRLSGSSDVLFQLVCVQDGKPIATGGLYNTVGLHKEYPRFQKLNPWVALLYTDQVHRHQGLGAKLLEHIEELAQTMQFKELYLYTFTAEDFYLKRNWKQIERVNYKNHDTVVMRKEI